MMIGEPSASEMVARSASEEQLVLIVSGHVVVKPEARDDFLTQAAPVLARVRTEDGVLDFTLAADPVHPERVIVLEIWVSMDHLRNHREHQNHVDLGAIISAFRLRLGSLTKYRVDASAPMMAPDGQLLFDFPDG
jgi:quinol monooxygenase YgiN